jgi:hypothetical protein
MHFRLFQIGKEELKMIDKKIYLALKFMEYNKQLFNNRLSLPTIETDKTLNCLGLYGGTQNVILIKDQLFQGDNITLRSGNRYELGRMSFVDGTLLHEMAHQNVWERHGLRLNKDHCHDKPFQDVCDILGAMLNYRSCQSYEQWPITAVTPSYFCGAFIDEHRLQAYLM